MLEANVYVEGVKYSFIGLVVGMSSVIVVDDVKGLRILLGSGFWDLWPSIHQIVFDSFKIFFFMLYLSKQSSGKQTNLDSRATYDFNLS